MGDLDPCLIHGSLGGPPECSIQTASRSVQPFCKAHYWYRQTDRPTDHATLSVTIGRIYARSTAMRPNNNIRISIAWYDRKFCGGIQLADSQAYT